MITPMSAKDDRVGRGQLLASRTVSRLRTELRTARQDANLSQVALAKRLDWAQTRYSRFERNVDPITVADLCLVATILGFRPRFDLFRENEGLRDQGAQALVERFCSVLSPLWAVRREAPSPILGDLRSWDLLIRLGNSFRVGIEAETRLRELEELVRRIRQRELHGGVDAIVVVLRKSSHNRANVGPLRQALGGRFATSPRNLLAALRAGTPLPGSGVLLL
jgi:transcriptional regulator with XRE-family HTH domain